MTSWLATKFRHSRGREEHHVLPFCDGKSPEVRKAEARRAQYEHRQRILAVPELEKLFAAREG
ncbi:MAG: hypothetical protein E6G45_06910 [Actinobacteria bacterium]|nr:MAG: hypothetical protein E6G45_06910 [Actinomycetota bacterium]